MRQAYIECDGETAGPFRFAWLPRIGESVWFPQSWRRPSPAHQSPIVAAKVIQVQHKLDEIGTSQCWLFVERT